MVITAALANEGEFGCVGGYTYAEVRTCANNRSYIVNEGEFSGVGSHTYRGTCVDNSCFSERNEDDHKIRIMQGKYFIH